MDLAEIIRAVKNITQALEKLSKRLRRVEVLSRLADIEQVDTFLDLADTPDSYVGMYGWVPSINNLEDGLEFVPVGGACVAFTCGPVGWRAVGGTDPRTLVHEEAFQLDADGDDRGAYAVDLQQVRSNADEVASGPFSAILGGEDNRITGGAASEYASISGGNANYLDDAYDCHVHGSYHEVFASSYAVHVSGEGMDIDECSYGFFAGTSHEVTGTHAFGNALGVASFIELNEIHSNANDYPTYDVQMGIINVMEGDVFVCIQLGEENSLYGAGTPGEHALWVFQFGYGNYAGHVENNIMLGNNGRSYRPTYDTFYDGRIVWSGEYSNKSPAAAPGGSSVNEIGSGYNQDSWFSQNDLITDWAAAAAWTTSRFEFPIIIDSIWGFLAYIVGTEQGCANSYLWKIEGIAENDGGTTTILASTVTNVYRDVATKEWQVIADDPNDRLVFQYRDTAGADATDCNIQLSMMTMEVGFAA